MNDRLIEFDQLFNNYFEGLAIGDDFKNKSLQTFYSKLHKNVIHEALETACNKIPDDPDACIKYFCGICWRLIRQENGNLNNEAQEVIDYWRKISYISPYKMSQFLNYIGKKEAKDLFQNFMEQIEAIMNKYKEERQSK